MGQVVVIGDRELVKRQQLREELCSRTSQAYTPLNDDDGGRAA